MGSASRPLRLRLGTGSVDQYDQLRLSVIGYRVINVISHRLAGTQNSRVRQVGKSGILVTAKAQILVERPGSVSLESLLTHDNLMKTLGAFGGKGRLGGGGGGV